MWKHPHKSPISAAFGDPVHFVQDILTTEDQRFTINGRFAYGMGVKTLEGESILGFLNIGNEWIFVGEMNTDTDGRICGRVTMPQPLSPGIYGLRCQVVGDETVAEGWLWIRPRETHLRIFDIDGTLTTSDIEIIHGEPELYPGAVELTQAEASRDHVIVYLTGRPYWLATTTRAWLRRHPFAQGVLRVANAFHEAMPWGVGGYKRQFLKELQANGFVIDVAYGNATTDIDAYLGAGLMPDKVFIIGKHGGERETHAVDGSWEERVRALKAPPAVAQPSR
jgi:phosphatidate phosphatase PAH1